MKRSNNSFDNSENNKKKKLSSFPSSSSSDKISFPLEILVQISLFINDASTFRNFCFCARIPKEIVEQKKNSIFQKGNQKRWKHNFFCSSK
jgi:hypothetical protein